MPSKADRAKMTKLLQHTKVKAFPKWKNTGHAVNTVQNMDKNQTLFYQACLDHARGKSDITDFYPGLSPATVKDIESHSDHPALDSLARNAGSSSGLARWHRQQFTKSAGGWVQLDKKGGLKESLTKGVKLKKAGNWATSAGKKLVAGIAYAAEKGVELAKKFWGTVQSAARELKKFGQKAAAWVARNPEKISKMIGLVAQGFQVYKAIKELSGDQVIPEDVEEKVSADKKAKVEALMKSESKDEDDGDEWTDSDAESDDGMTVEEMLAKRKETKK